MNFGAIVKSVKNPKVHLIGLLLLLAALGTSKQYPVTLPAAFIIQIGIAVLIAILAEWAFFGNIGTESLRSAAITGMLCGMILIPGIEPHIIWVIVTAAVASKFLFRTFSGKHIFNPAALGLVLGMFIFGNRMNWWGFSNVYIVIAIGGIVIYRLNRLSMVFSYIIFRFLSASIFTGSVDSQVFLSQNLFFAFIMLPEPKTSPSGRLSQWFFGGICGILSSLFFVTIPSLDGDLLALLAANPLRFLSGILKYKVEKS